MGDDLTNTPSDRPGRPNHALLHRRAHTADLDVVLDLVNRGLTLEQPAPVKPDRGVMGVWVGFKLVTGLAAVVMIGISLLILFSKATTDVDTSKLRAGTRVGIIQTAHGPQATYDCPSPFDWLTGAPHSRWCAKREHSELGVGEPVVLAFFAAFAAIFLYAGHRRRRIREAAAVGVRLPGIGERPTATPTVPAVPFDPPPDDRRAVGPPDIVLRPRLVAVIAAAGVWIGLLIPLTVIGFDEGRINPRVPLYALLVAVAVFFSIRARLTVADRRLRQAIGKREIVSLDRLAFVQIARPSLLRQQGYVRTRLAIGDRYGRTIAIKPALWTCGARRLLALLDVCARSQGIAVDDSTRQHLGAAAAASDRRCLAGPTRRLHRRSCRPVWSQAGRLTDGGPVGTTWGRRARLSLSAS